MSRGAKIEHYAFCLSHSRIDVSVTVNGIEFSPVVIELKDAMISVEKLLGAARREKKQCVLLLVDNPRVESVACRFESSGSCSIIDTFGRNARQNMMFFYLAGHQDIDSI
jgi:hypothetical protein